MRFLSTKGWWITRQTIFANGGHWSQDRALAAGDFRAFSPRFRGENLERNLALVEALRAVAEEKGATVAQIAIA